MYNIPIGKKGLYFFYDIAEKYTQLLQRMGDGKFSVLTYSYINAAFNQLAFRIHKCYIVCDIRVTINMLYNVPIND